MFRSLTTFCLVLCMLAVAGGSAKAALICGDADGNMMVNVLDVGFVSNYVFRDGPAPDPLLDGNADGCMSVNIADAVRIFRYLMYFEPLGDCQNTDDCSEFVAGNSVPFLMKFFH